MNISCRLWGHHIDNRVAAVHDVDRRCRCGTPYLARDGSLTRVRHTLSCFLRHHTYVPLSDRHGCREYVCVRCGHPLLFDDAHDPYRKATRFEKRVRYLCGLFGHRVTRVTEREGAVEYGCRCGHTFLKNDGGLATIRHPMVCVLLGHFVRYVTARGGYDEYVCVNCGHPFCFGGPHVAAAAAREPAA